MPISLLFNALSASSHPLLHIRCPSLSPTSSTLCKSTALNASFHTPPLLCFLGNFPPSDMKQESTSIPTCPEILNMLFGDDKWTSFSVHNNRCSSPHLHIFSADTHASHTYLLPNTHRSSVTPTPTLARLLHVSTRFLNFSPHTPTHNASMPPSSPRSLPSLAGVWPLGVSRLGQYSRRPARDTT